MSPAAMLNDDVILLDLSTEAAFLVVCVEQEMTGGSRELVFVSKVIPGREYEIRRDRCSDSRSFRLRGKI